MKKFTKTLTAIGLSILLVGTLTNADAQGKGRGNGKNDNPGRGNGKSSWNNPGKGHDKKYDKRFDNDRDERTAHFDRDFRDGHDHWDRHDHYRHEARLARHRHHHFHHRPYRNWVSVQHNYVRPRYVFYRDYNVYYDCAREVYISLSHGRWIVTTGMPLVLRRVNLAAAVAVGVDYYGDDFSTFVVRKRPAYFSVRAVF